MKVYFVGAGPGDPKLITVRGKELLEAADLVVYTGSLVNAEVLQYTNGITINSFRMTLEEIVTVIVDALQRGETVVRLHSGDPALYSAIDEQISALESCGIDYEIIPGVSSVFASAAALGKQLTRDTLIITRPSGKTLEMDKIAELSEYGTTMAIFLGVDRIAEIVHKLRYPPTTPVGVVYHASWADQTIITGTISDIVHKVRQAGITRSAIILVGDDLSKRNLRRSFLYSKMGKKL
ncbi:MAG: SAM-dependent methyltransferase [Halobacteriota archaeon]